MKTTYSIQDFLMTKTAAYPVLSHDMSKVVFASNIKGETFQLYYTHVVGSEIKQLTDLSEPVTDFKLSPTASQLIFLKDDKGNENYQIHLLHIDSGVIKPLTEKPQVKHMAVSWSPDGNTVTYSSNEKNGKDFDIYIKNIETGIEECIYANNGYFVNTGFSPQGNYCVFAKANSNVDQELFLYNVQTKELTEITKREAGKEEYYSASVHWAPDESAIYTLSDVGREFKAIWKYDIQKQKGGYVFEYNWDVDNFAVSEDGKKLFIVLNENGSLTLRAYILSDMKEIPLSIPKGNVYDLDLDPTGELVVYSFGSAVQNRNIFTLDLKNGDIKQLTDMPMGVSKDILVRPEEIWFESFDGLKVPAFVYKPQNIEAGKKLPVLIDIHGGPEAQAFNGLNTINQFFVNSGFVVVIPNVRGSSGYGKTYLSLDNIEKRMDSVKDMVSLREYLKTLSYVDENKIVLMGGSYGGFMVLAGLAFYPDLWAAGIDIVGISNFITFLENTAPYRRAIREAEYGYLERDRELLISISPIHKADQIQASLMVVHGVNDPRVPFDEAKQVVEKVRSNGKEVEFLVYEDEGHGLGKLKNKFDAYPKMVSFLQRVLKL